MGRGRVILRLFPVLPRITRKTTGTRSASYYADLSLGLSTFRAAWVKMLSTKMIYHLGNYTRDNVVSHAQIESVRAGPFKWEQLGIDLLDIEALSEKDR